MNIQKIKLELVKFLSLTTMNHETASSFAHIKNYEAKTTGEIATHKVLLNFSYHNALLKDYKKMQSIDLIANFEQFEIDFKKAIDKKLKMLNKVGASIKIIEHYENLSSKLTFDVYSNAFEGAFNSVTPIGEKMYNGNTKEQNEQSKKQIEIYDKINGSVKYHSGNDTLYVYAKSVEKYNYIKQGTPKLTKNGIAVFCKGVISKDFKSKGYRNFIVNRIDVLNALKHSFKGNEITI